MSRCLKSGLAPAIRAMIDYKVSLGYEESTYLPRSHSLDRYCTEHFPDETSLTREVVTGWLERHPGESIGYFHSRAGYARGLGKYLASMGIPAGYRYGHTTPASVNLNGTAKPAFGVNVGVMYDITGQLTAGVSFRSKMDLTVDAGTATVRYADDLAAAVLQPSLGIINQANFEATMPAPYVLSFGLGYKPTDRWTVALDAQLTGWKAYKSLDVEFLDDRLTPFDQHIAKNYRNAWAVKAGAQFAATKRLDVRAGLMVDTTPVRDDNYNPETPGTTKIEPAIGLSFRPVKGLSIDFALMYVAGLNANNRSCTYTDLLAASQPALGLPATRTFTADYSIRAWTPSLGLSYAF